MVVLLMKRLGAVYSRVYVTVMTLLGDIMLYRTRNYPTFIRTVVKRYVILITILKKCVPVDDLKFLLYLIFW